MFAYDLLGAVIFMALALLWRKKGIDSQGLEMCGSLVNEGWAFLTIGMLFGSFWTKEA